MQIPVKDDSIIFSMISVKKCFNHLIALLVKGFIF